MPYGDTLYNGSAKPEIPVPRPDTDKGTGCRKQDTQRQAGAAEPIGYGATDSATKADTYPEHKLCHTRPVLQLRTDAQCREQHETHDADDDNEEQHAVRTKFDSSFCAAFLPFWSRLFHTWQYSMSSIALLL